MKAIIMAGGEGSRLRPLTCDLPKPMVPLFNKPVMEYAIELLAAHGITDIGVTLHYLPDKIMSYFGDGSDFGVRLRYYIEDKPLGTAGSVAQAIEELDDTFVVISGDALTDCDLKAALDFHRQNCAAATIVTKQVPVPLEYGVIITDSDGRITRFLEKPGWSEVFSDAVNTGIYILQREVMKAIPANVAYDFSRQLFANMLKDGDALYGFPMRGYWCDIGDITQYIQAHRDVLDRRITLNLSAQWDDEGNLREPSAPVLDNIKIHKPCYIGRSELKDCEIGPYTVINEGAAIEAGASVKRSILLSGSKVSAEAQVRGALLCSNSSAGDGSALYEGSVLGASARLGDRATLLNDVKVWPEKSIDRQITVSRNVIWGARSGGLFDGRGAFCALPEDAVLLCAAYASTFNKDMGAPRIGIAKAGGALSGLMAQAAMSGAASAGAAPVSLSELTIPMMRFAIRRLGLDGGIYVYSSGAVELYGSDGAPVSEDIRRKVEGLYIRQDFLRAMPGDIENTLTTGGVRAFYLRSLISRAEMGGGLKAAREAAPSISIRSSNEKLLSLAAELFMEAGIKARFGDLSHMPPDDTGFVIEDDENIRVFSQGKELSEAQYAALLTLCAINGGAKTLVAPVTATRVLESIADEVGGTVRRVKASRSEWIRALYGLDLDQRDGMGEFLCGLHFDALASILFIISFIYRGKSLAEIIASVPSACRRTASVSCEWGDKGKILRMLSREAGDGADFTDGVRIERDGGWALILPSADAPNVRIIAESMDTEFANELCDMFVRRVEEIKGADDTVNAEEVRQPQRTAAENKFL